MRKLTGGIDAPNEDLKDAIKVRKIKIEGSAQSVAQTSIPKLNSKASLWIANIERSFFWKLGSIFSDFLSLGHEKQISNRLVITLGTGWYGVEVFFLLFCQSMCFV